MHTQCFRAKYRVVISKRDTRLVIEMVGVAVVTLCVFSTQWDPVRNTGVFVNECDLLWYWRWQASPSPRLEYRLHDGIPFVILGFL